ncbi:TPA: DNA cytosine methyltransferase [Yersinia enterocolitica]|uniref:DNA (cytosine-5-)-methyltransferase n=2 Tax=Yersinia enterocolitica TaxID=630 RepID=A0A0H3NKE8_YERE1|nr:DNA (cytosine-5-)-methyltransferase [Yersinia enterocolitica]AOF13669.1 DNA (cytosine-5-)-methyltransferase [Yersinia enterocolitica]AOF17759.1 DNA (cytosine-5-)-methyltransferase [Yersinia enterocolitica]AOF22293.1 DNA (cytosine-5-)-methyltransferase [Yersinia enterocolitica]AOF26002.1 DNA (cytosine-5-)-methyltransferase [Yersinia enterocolitica]AOF30114.1 DNA (cytosine-5-)-methyltransferase [Yersinia enterocolitica]
MKFAEFFAGVGLIREGLSSSGWKCVWANDISADKMATYVANYGEEHFHLEDIWKVAANPGAILPEGVFLYTASFPCTDLSVAGARAGLAGVESGTLNAVLKILEYKKSVGDSPKVVMLENVSGFLTSHNGNDVAETVRALSNLNYIVDIIELDAALFTPQSRPRVFVIAVLRDIASSVMHIKQTDNIFDDWWQKFDEQPSLRSNKLKRIIASNEGLNWGLIDVPLPTQRTSELADIIDIDIQDDSKLWWDETRKQHLYSQMNPNHQAKLSVMIQSPSYVYGTVFRRMRAGSSMAELRTDGVAGCLRTPRGGSSKQILVRAGGGSWDVRLLTPREYARLQGVRDTFLLPDNLNKGYFAMGDAVCVPAIEHLSKHVLLPLFKGIE